MKDFIYGIDIGGTNIKIGLFKQNPTRLVNRQIISTPKLKQETEIFNVINKKLIEINKSENISFSNIIGIGVTVPCPVICGKTGVCANVNLSNYDIESNFKSIFPKNVIITVSNDANMAALGEFKNSKQKYDNAAFYTLGTGVGGGLIIDGKIVEGRNGSSGEFGHIRVFEGLDEPCGCGSNGCLEQLAGTKGLINMVKRYSEYEPTILDLNKLSVKDIFMAAKQGDKPALRAVNRAMEAIAISASILAVTVDPDVFIIGGGISNAGDFLINKLTQYYKKHARFNTGNIPFTLAKLKNDAGMYGAVHYLLNKLEYKLP